jgi:hypothetical protein
VVTHARHEFVFVVKHSLKKYIIYGEPYSVSSHNLSIYSLFYSSMQLVVVIESTTYPMDTFDHWFVIWKLSDWLQHQIDGTSKARQPHNSILLTHQHACILIIRSIVSHDLHYTFLVELNGYFFDLLQKNTYIRISISHRGNNKEWRRRLIVTQKCISRPHCGRESLPICEKNITPLQYAMKFMMLVPVESVHESYIRVPGW